MTARLRLKKHEDRRLRAGHAWVFSNEVDAQATPLSQFAPGEPVLLEAAGGKVLGSGYVNPGSLICARLVSRDPAYLLDRSLIVHRLNIALALRERLFPAPYYRLVYGESDGLPGLVVDRYGDLLVAQITTAGMERVKDEIVAALQKVIHPRGVLWRNDGGSRDLEGLPRYVETGTGEVPASVVMEENGVRFRVDPVGGQKTGWFFDQRANRARLMRYARDARVLDVFSYSGAWGIQAAVAGAAQVLCVDGSQSAVDAVTANAELNAVSAQVSTHKQDAFEALKQLRANGEHYDIVIVDPPALIKRKKDLKEGTLAYQRLAQAALPLLGRDGLLVMCSCSYHLPTDSLRTVLAKAARHVDRFVQILEQGHQAPDHPVHPAIPETEYLKAFFCRVLPS